jgi:hypothetical protein
MRLTKITVPSIKKEEKRALGRRFDNLNYR